MVSNQLTNCKWWFAWDFCDCTEEKWKPDRMQIVIKHFMATTMINWQCWMVTMSHCIYRSGCFFRYKTAARTLFQKGHITNSPDITKTWDMTSAKLTKQTRLVLAFSLPALAQCSTRCSSWGEENSSLGFSVLHSPKHVFGVKTSKQAAFFLLILLTPPTNGSRNSGKLLSTCNSSSLTDRPVHELKEHTSHQFNIEQWRAIIVDPKKTYRTLILTSAKKSDALSTWLSCPNSASNSYLDEYQWYVASFSIPDWPFDMAPTHAKHTVY